MRVITDEQYQRWLGDTTSLRVLLAEVNAFVGGQEVTYRMGSEFFATEPSDTPANATYEGLLIGQPSFTSRMQEAFGGSTFVSYGSIIVDNTGGARDDWLFQSFGGRPVVLKIGDPDWGIDDYRVIFNGVVDRIDASDDESLELSIRDKQRLFDQPIQDRFLDADVETEGPLIPLCYGEVYNITPANDPLQEARYVIHDGPIEEVSAVYVNGVPSVTWTANLEEGYITFSEEVGGTVTCDVKGANDGGYINTVPDIAAALISRVSNAPENLELSVKRLREVDWGNAVVGVYFDQRQNLLDALDSLGTGFYYGFDREGEFYVNPLSEPSNSIATIDDIETYDSIGITKLERPVWKVRVGYKRNYTVQNSLDEEVTAEQKSFASAEYISFAYHEDESIKEEFILAREPDHVRSIMISEDDAGLEAERLLSLFGKQRYVITVSAYAKPLTLSIGDTITLVDGRYGMQEGVDFIVVGLNEYLIDSKVDLELWR